MKDTAEFVPMLIVVLLQTLNLACIGIIIKYITNTGKIQIEEFYVRPIGLFITFLLFCMNYLFIYRKRQSIFQKHKDMTVKRKLFGKIFTVFFVVFSYLSLFIVAAKYDVVKPPKTDLQLKSDSLDSLYNSFSRTHDYHYLRLYYKEINLLVQKDSANKGLKQNKEMLEKIYGDSLRLKKQ
jgi:hypothetical protein